MTNYKINPNNIVIDVDNSSKVAMAGYKQTTKKVICGQIKTQNGFENPQIKIEDAKNIKIELINSACGFEIISGFLSEALGVEYKYEGEQVDQINLIGLVTAGNDDLLKSGLAEPKENETDEDVYIWEFRQHTIAQLTQVFSDGVNYKKGLLFKAMTLKAQIAEATTVDAIDAIVW